MSDKKYQVFISSTYSDLKEERRKILDVLLKTDCIPAGMEAFVASDIEQFDVIKKVIELCDYYILIIGKRYGSINEKTGLSYTEMEYDFAKQLGIPILVFAIDECVDLDETKKEKDIQKIDALHSFRQKVLNNRLATIWKTQDELISAVAVSISRAIKEMPRKGWQRTSNDSATEIERLKAENLQLHLQIASMKQTAKSFTEDTQPAFDDCTFTLQYSYTPSGSTTKFNNPIEKGLPELFRIIATEMMDVALTEETIKVQLTRALFLDDSYRYTLLDTQIIKRILNQLRSLNLVRPEWNNDKSQLFWGLTSLGIAKRDELIVVYNNK